MDQAVRPLRQRGRGGPAPERREGEVAADGPGRLRRRQVAHLDELQGEPLRLALDRERRPQLAREHAAREERVRPQDGVVRRGRPERAGVPFRGQQTLGQAVRQGHRRSRDQELSSTGCHLVPSGGARFDHVRAPPPGGQTGASGGRAGGGAAPAGSSRQTKRGSGPSS